MTTHFQLDDVVEERFCVSEVASPQRQVTVTHIFKQYITYVYLSPRAWFYHGFTLTTARRTHLFSDQAGLIHGTDSLLNRTVYDGY